ncbi:MAG: hypothetical protein NUV86_12885 [Candidatus Scalindua sp.]|nr:hypothetical protein [Candidatus Scalindua sp.]MCR4344971.1 hypothetical protein [Candidatus Scalindua sp.]
MKTIDISSDVPSIKKLLDMAKKESLLIKTIDGESFVISSTDEFDSEIELLRKNHKFLSMLDDFKSSDETIPIDEVEKNLR